MISNLIPAKLPLGPVISALLRSKSGPVLLLMQIILSVAVIANASFIIIERLNMMGRESGVVETQLFDFYIYNFKPQGGIAAQHHRDIQVLRELPGVQNAVATNMIPIGGSGWQSTFELSPDTETAKETPQTAQYFGDEQFIDTLGLSLVEGRNFYQQDIKTGTSPHDATEVIITKAFAEAIWGDEPALGKNLYQTAESVYKVIGIVEKLQGGWVEDDDIENSIIMGVERTSNFNKYIIRATPGDFQTIQEQILERLLADNPNRVIGDFNTMTERRDRSYRNHELMASMLSLIVALLLLITALGTAGLVMFNIQRRAKQIGTRRAIGATKRDILLLFLTENYLICLVGCVLGGLLAVQLGHQLMTVYSLPMLDLRYALYTVVGLVMLTTIATLLPANRAAKISPAIATRSI